MVRVAHYFTIVCPRDEDDCVPTNPLTARERHDLAHEKHHTRVWCFCLRWSGAQKHHRRYDAVFFHRGGRGRRLHPRLHAGDIVDVDREGDGRAAVRVGVAGDVGAEGREGCRALGVKRLPTLNICNCMYSDEFGHLDAYLGFEEFSGTVTLLLDSNSLAVLRGECDVHFASAPKMND